MRRALALLTLCAAALSAQSVYEVPGIPAQLGGIVFPTLVVSDPTGGCTNEATLLLSLASGHLFTCFAGNYVSASSGGGAAGAFSGLTGNIALAQFPVGAVNNQSIFYNGTNWTLGQLSFGQIAGAATLTQLPTGYPWSEIAGGPTWLPGTDPLTTLGDTLYGGAAGVLTRLAANTSNLRTFQMSLSIAGSPQAPVWSLLQSGDIPNNAANTSGSAATANALAANPALCPSGQLAQGILASGNATGCAAVVTTGSQASNMAFLAPNGYSGTPGFRLIMPADLPSIPYTQITGFSFTNLTGAPVWVPTSNPFTTTGDLLYGNASNVPTRLAADTSNTRKFLRTQSISSAPQVPVWDILQSGDIPNNAANTTGNAYTATGLEASPTLCSTGYAPTGILASGNATGCAALGSFGSQAANTVYAGPNGTTGSPAFRLLVAADLPSIPATQITGQFPVSQINFGTGPLALIGPEGTTCTSGQPTSGSDCLIFNAGIAQMFNSVGFVSTTVTPLSATAGQYQTGINSSGVPQFGNAPIVADSFANIGFGPSQNLFTSSSTVGSIVATPIGATTSPTLAVTGTGGSTTYTYNASCIDGNGIAAGASTTATTGATGNATLSGSNYVALSVTPQAGCVSYNFFRTGGGATAGNIGNVVVATGATASPVLLSDTGQTASPLSGSAGGSAPVTDGTGDMYANNFEKGFASTTVSTTTTTLNINGYGIFRLLLNSSTTIGFAGGAPQSTTNAPVLTFMLKQGASGGPYVPTFPTSVKWPGGLVPTWSTTAGYRDIITISWDPSSQAWYGHLDMGYQN